MKIGFFNVFRGDPVHLVLADLMIESARMVMPDVPVVQLTDAVSPAAYGVDEVRRLPHAPFDVLRTNHLIACEGDWLYVDSDVIFQKPIQAVFEDPFDVAVCDREGCLVDGEEDLKFIQATPHNLGVVFSRSQAFWTAVKEKLVTMPMKRQEWMGIQFAACEVIAEGRFRVKILPGKQYNYPPHNLREDMSGVSILHYKGPDRKRMMLERYLKVGV